MFDIMKRFIPLSFAAYLLGSGSLVVYADSDPVQNETISQDAQEFYQLFQQELQRIDDANKEGLDSGLIVSGSNDYSATFGIYGTMRMYADYMDKMYGATDPYTYSSIPAGGSCTGLYKVSGDNSYHVVTVSTAGSAESTMVIADDYTVTATCNPKTANYTFGSLTNDNYFGYKVESSSSFSVALHSEYQDVGRFGDYNYVTNKYSCWLRFGMNSNSVPTINPATVLTYVNETVGGYPAYSIIPDGQIDPDRPWDYYNDVLVPDILATYSQFPDIAVDQLPLGTQYEPAHTDPIEPPTAPHLSPVIKTQPVTEIIEVTDESGNVIETETVEVTDESGEPVTETVYETEDTSAAAYLYDGEFASLPGFDIPDLDIPAAEVPSEVAGNVSNMFTLCVSLLEDSGLMDIFTLVMVLGLVGFILMSLAK